MKNAAVWAGSAVVAAVVAVLTLWKQFVERANLKGGLSTAFAYVESVLAVVFSVVLLLALHGASWFIRVHRVAFRALLSHRHIGFCFAFLYGFPALVHHVFPWAPPWAPVCLWYAFLVQLFCTNGPTAMMTTFRIILPLVFLVEGISHHSFLLDLNGNDWCTGACIVINTPRADVCVVCLCCRGRAFADVVHPVGAQDEQPLQPHLLPVPSGSGARCRAYMPCSEGK